MLFLWQTTDLGKIWLDGDGIKASLSKRLPKEFYLRDLSFVGNSGLLNLYIAVSEDAVSASKRAVESRISTLFAGSGITVSVNWMYIAPKDNRKVTTMWRLPLFWAAAAAGVTALFHMGIRGILWSIFAAIAAYGIGWAALTEEGQKQVNSLIKRFRR